MKIKLPFITKDEINDGKRIFEYEDREVEVDNSLNCQMRWESNFPELAKNENIVDYAIRIKQLKNNSLPVLISQMKIIYCFLIMDIKFEAFLKMFDISNKDYVEKWSKSLKIAFEAILNGASEKN